jgi:hypothetical protein
MLASAKTPLNAASIPFLNCSSRVTPIPYDPVNKLTSHRTKRQFPDPSKHCGGIVLTRTYLGRKVSLDRR